MKPRFLRLSTAQKFKKRVQIFLPFPPFFILNIHIQLNGIFLRTKEKRERERERKVLSRVRTKQAYIGLIS